MSVSVETPKVIATRLAATAATHGVRFPKVWDEKQILQKCFSTLMLFKEDGKFNEEGSLNDLIETYGEDVVVVKAAKGVKAEKGDVKAEGADKKKRAKDEKESAEEEGAEETKAKKPKMTETVANEANRPIADAILEIASSYYKNGDRMKGGVFSKGAKAIRECETPILTRKEALALKGVGKGIAAYIEEFHANGCIEKLENLRAGIA